MPALEYIRSPPRNSRRQTSCAQQWATAPQIANAQALNIESSLAWIENEHAIAIVDSNPKARRTGAFQFGI
jgi:hypothetical protein